MKKKITIVISIICILIIGIILIPDNENKNPDYTEADKVRLENFKGDWECEENPLNDPDNYTGYIKLHMNDNGEFRMYDGETDSTLIEGAIAISSNSHLVMYCSPNVDFNPPPVWETMNNVEQIKYKFKSEEKLYLKYEKEKRESSTLIFTKETV